MGKSRYDVDRATKLAEILDEAEARFLADGYTGVSMAGIARAVGVAPNAVSWYYPSKDELFVAVLDRMLQRGREQLAAVASDPAATSRSVTEWILWAADRLYELRQLAIDLHQRMTISPAAADFHDRLHRELGTLLASAVQGLVSSNDLDTLVALISTTIEGQLLHHAPADRRHQLLRAILANYRIRDQAPWTSPRTVETSP